jgi:hypothetical protein
VVVWELREIGDRARNRLDVSLHAQPGLGNVLPSQLQKPWTEIQECNAVAQISKEQRVSAGAATGVENAPRLV